MKVLNGVWQSGNVFIDKDTGEIIKVITYNWLYELYSKSFPLECFITLEDEKRIIQVFPLDKNILPVG